MRRAGIAPEIRLQRYRVGPSLKYLEPAGGLWSNASVPRTRGRWSSLRWRAARANTSLLLAGIACVLIALVGSALSLGGVSLKGPASGTTQILLLLVGVLLIGLALFVGVADPPTAELDEIADAFADQAVKQWKREASIRRLVTPAPISVRWMLSELPVAGPVGDAIGSASAVPRFSPLPGLAAVTRLRLQSGGLGDLHAVYGGLESGRLVIIGAPGAGKSGAAIMLTLSALEHRTQVAESQRKAVPVPFLTTLRDWDPTSRPFAAWLVDRLSETHPVFAGRRGRAGAAALIEAGRVAVLLDGLDEVPEHVRARGLEALSEQASCRLVVLTRSAEMVAVAPSAHLVSAAAIELQSVDAEAAADYLGRIQLMPAPTGWNELVARVRHNPRGPLARALSSPLTLTLLRDTYRRDDDVGELLLFEGTTGGGDVSAEIEHVLLDRVLPIAYGARAGEPTPAYDLSQARHALTYLAVELDRRGSRDLAWWNVPEWTSSGVRVLVRSVGAGLAIGLGVLAYSVLPELAAMLVVGPLIGISAGLVWGIAESTPGREPPLRWRNFQNRDLLAVGVIIGGAAGAAFSVAQSDLKRGLAISLVVGCATVLALPTESSDPRARSPIDPLEVWKADRRFWLGSATLVGLMFVVLVLLGSGDDMTLPQRLAFVVAGVEAGLAAGLLAGEVASSSIAFLQLSFRERTPARLMSFLEDARRRDVLRSVGPVYQFRHARLQDHLARGTGAPSVPTTARSP